MRRLFFVALLLATSCFAQVASNSELDRKIEKQVRTSLRVPAYFKVTVGERTPSTDFPGYSQLNVTVSDGSRSSKLVMLLSKDNKTLVSVLKMDLTRDPGAEAMSKMDLKGRPVRGNKDAKVTVVVYDDYQCPYCSQMHKTLNDVLKSYGDRIKVVYKDFPLLQIHPWAERAAIDSNCLAKQSDGAFWDFADYVHANGRSIQGEKRDRAVQAAEVDRITIDMGKRHSADAAKLESCVKEQPKEDLQASMKEAETLGVEATPAIFINGTKLDGAVPEEELKMVLDAELKSAGAEPPPKPADAKADKSSM